MSFIIVSEGFVFVAKNEPNALSYLTKSLHLTNAVAENLINEAAAAGDARHLDKSSGSIVIVYDKKFFGTSFA